MQDLKPTFEHYYPAGVIGPGTGRLRGQCAVFCQALIQMPLVGDTIQTKTAAVKKYGLPPQANYLPGDVLILNVGTAAGHVAIVSSQVGSDLRLSESNWRNDLRVSHDRMIPKNSKQIVGIFRGPLKVKIINPTPPPMPTKPEIRIVVIDDKQAWPDFDQQVAKFKQLAQQWSNDQLSVVIQSIVQTNFDPAQIPLEVYSSGTMGTFQGPSRAWQKANIYQYRNGADIIIFNHKDFAETGHQGYALAPDEAGGPFVLMCEVTNTPLYFQQNGMTEFTKLALHECAHALRAITGQETLPVELRDESRQITSWTHFYDYASGHSLSEAYSTLNFVLLQQNLELRRQQQQPMPKYFKAQQAGKLGIMVLEGFSGTLLFEDQFSQYQTLLSISSIPANAPVIDIPAGRFFKINDHGKLGIMIVEGFTGAIVFENDFAEYQTLLQITGITDMTPIITLP